jgi:hypothetical protein
MSKSIMQYHQVKTLASAPGVSHSCTNFARPNANHARSLSLVKCSNLLFGFTEGHPVLKFAQFGLSVSVLSFSSPGLKMSMCVDLSNPNLPPASSSFFRTITRNGKCFHNLSWWWSGKPIDMLLYLIS